MNFNNGEILLWIYGFVSLHSGHLSGVLGCPPLLRKLPDTQNKMKMILPSTKECSFEETTNEDGDAKFLLSIEEVYEEGKTREELIEAKIVIEVFKGDKKSSQLTKLFKIKAGQ